VAQSNRFLFVHMCLFFFTTFGDTMENIKHKSHISSVGVIDKKIQNTGFRHIVNGGIVCNPHDSYSGKVI
jgi:hypothetical protein